MINDKLELDRGNIKVYDIIDLLTNYTPEEIVNKKLKYTLDKDENYKITIEDIEECKSLYNEHKLYFNIYELSMNAKQYVANYLYESQMDNNDENPSEEAYRHILLYILYNLEFIDKQIGHENNNKFIHYYNQIMKENFHKEINLIKIYKYTNYIYNQISENNNHIRTTHHMNVHINNLIMYFYNRYKDYNNLYYI
jgi:hypothetical protein